MQSRKDGLLKSVMDPTKNKWGTSSWRILADTNESKQWAGLNVIPGRKDDQSAFRSDTGGDIRYGSGDQTHMQVFHISNGLVSFGSDCEADLYYIFDLNKKSTGTTNYFDLIMATRKVLDQLPIGFSHHHVPAHQDISRDEIDIWGRANNDRDTDDKAF
jgi:hypothetical protein